MKSQMLHGSPEIRSPSIRPAIDRADRAKIAPRKWAALVSAFVLSVLRRMSVSYKSVNEVLLALASDLRCLVDADVSVVVMDCGFFDFEETSFHGSLRRAVPVSAFTLDQIAVVSHPGKESALSHINAILLDDFGQITDQDACVAGRHCVGEECFWLHLCIGRFKALLLL